MQVHARTALEPIFCVESSRFRIDCMDEDGTTSDDLRTRVCALQRILQQRGTETMSLFVLIYSQTRQQNDWYWIRR